ncbi:MAG: polysaccharide deacetylase family protein [Myxococcota bacterium]
MSGWVAAVARVVARTGVHRALPARGPLIVMYHGIGGADGVSVESFGAQLEALACRRRIVPLAELADRIGHPSAIDLAAITFDDGYVDFAELALPLLARAGLHATLFVPAGLVGRSNVWDAGVMEPRRILDEHGLRDLDPGHVEVGAHGFSHRRIVSLDRAALETETLGSRRRLEAILQRSVRLFAYPYGQRGDFDRAAERAVEAAGFELACSTCFGRGSERRERYRLRRVGIEPQDDLDVVAAKLDGAYDWVAWKERAGHGLRTLRGRSSGGSGRSLNGVERAGASEADRFPGDG